jgi:hypothetical protein
VAGELRETYGYRGTIDDPLRGLVVVALVDG